MDFKKLGASVGAVNNQTIAVEGGGAKKERVPRAAGVGYGVLRDYIEFGIHPKKEIYGGGEVPTGIITFELNHDKHLVEIDGQMEPSFLSYNINNISNNPNSGFIKLVNKLNYNNDPEISHVVSMIGTKYLLTLTHRTDDKGKVWVNLTNDAKELCINSPIVDGIDGQTDYSDRIPNLKGEPKVFIWESDQVTDEQYLEMWNSIFIESNNWIQEKIKTNTKWNNSRLKALLEGLGTDELMAAVQPQTDGQPDTY